MAADYSFILKKIERLNELYAAFSPLTRMPLLVCDEETADDQVYIFESEEKGAAFAEKKKAEQIPAAVVKIPGEQIKGFFASLHHLAVNRVIYEDAAGVSEIELTALAPAPDMEKISKAPMPLMNPILCLTMVYFVQELKRPGEKDNASLRMMEEEMLSNMFKSRFIMAVEEVPAEKEGEKPQIRIPLLKTETGETYQPLFTDLAEYKKHAGANAVRFKVTALAFPQLLPSLVKEAGSFVVNPASCGLVLTRQRLEQLMPKKQPQNPDAAQQS